MIIRIKHTEDDDPDFEQNEIVELSEAIKQYPFLDPMLKETNPTLFLVKLTFVGECGIMTTELRGVSV